MEHGRNADISGGVLPKTKFFRANVCGKNEGDGGSEVRRRRRPFRRWMAKRGRLMREHSLIWVSSSGTPLNGVAVLHVAG